MVDPVEEPSISLRPFPSMLEIAGIVAGIVPFVISMSSSSVQTVNGRVTSFSYSDPVAIGGGIVAALFGLVAAATLLRHTEPAKRPLRILLCLALVGGGAFHILRGFGIAGIDKPEVSESTSITMPELPREIAPVVAKTDDAATETHKLVALWGDNKLKELYDLAHEDVLKAVDIYDLHAVHDMFAESFGKLEKAGELGVKTEGEAILVEGPAVFTKETLIVRVEFARVDGTLRWRNFALDVPKDVEQRPVAADGDAFARKVLDQLLANKLDPAVYHPRLVARAPADLGDKLGALLAEIGPIKKIEAPVERECKEARCLTFAITGKKKKATADFDLQYGGRVWRVLTWNITPE
jgi:hypothetical protein